MLEEKIKILREKLNKSIEKDEEYKKIYKISVELDELIVKYYKTNQKNKVITT